ncbi:hypothetical protein WJX82_011605 [Trebouxia sp. C0006]
MQSRSATPTIRYWCQWLAASVQLPAAVHTARSSQQRFAVRERHDLACRQLQDETYTMKLNMRSHLWEPVSCRGVPANRFKCFPQSNEDTCTISPQSVDNAVCARCAGVVHGGKLSYWVRNEDFLLQFGGIMAQDYVSPQEALWTFNVSSRTWRQQFASGVLLEPVTACGLAVANGRAYLLSFSHEREGVMEIYKLNLDTWRWRLLPCAGVIPPPAFGEPLKNQWLFHTGEHSCSATWQFAMRLHDHDGRPRAKATPLPR